MSLRTDLPAPAPWLVSPRLVERIVDRARLAPSIHNTQPWRWRVAPDSSLELWADRSRALVHADPDGRQLVVSCGTALHHAIVTAAACGLGTSVARLPDPEQPDLLARLRVRRGPPVQPVVPGPRRPGRPGQERPDRRAPETAAAGRALLRAEAVEDLLAIEARHTDRRRFTMWPVPSDRVARLAAAATHPDVQLLPLTAASARRRVDLVTEQARLAQARDLGVVTETARWIDRGGADGIPRGAVPLAQGLRGEHPHRFDTSLVDGTERVVEASEGLVVLLTATDGPLSWLRAGEALSCLWLRATREGFSVVPLSQAVEHAPSRAALAREMPGPLRHPQLLVRVGWQEIGRSTLPRTPRRPLCDVLAPGPSGP